MFDRITSDPAILGGKPIVRDTRISVEIILEWIAAGASRDDVIRKHRQLPPKMSGRPWRMPPKAVRNEVLVSANVGA